MNSPRFDVPIVAAPMGGGPSTPELVTAVSNAGGLGFLAAAYLSADAVEADIAAVRRATDRPFGVNVFVPSSPTSDDRVAGYVASLAVEAERYDTSVGEPRWSDDGWVEKLELAERERPDVVSFTFGCPDDDVIAGLQARDIAVWCTVTCVSEAEAAAAAGVDALVVQGAEAGAHRGSFTDDDAEALSLLTLLQLVRASVSTPLVAAGGIATGAAVAAVLCAGASAAQLGTAFLLCPEAGTTEVHRGALKAGGTTRFTRAFTGRRARGIGNRFMLEHDDAPSAYPEIHHATAPIRAAARASGDPEGVNLWAGAAFTLARELPAGEIVTALAAEARAALSSRRIP
jgi:nitronate monooxygenase